MPSIEDACEPTQHDLVWDDNTRKCKHCELCTQTLTDWLGQDLFQND